MANSEESEAQAAGFVTPIRVRSKRDANDAPGFRAKRQIIDAFEDCGTFPLTPGTIARINDSGYDLSALLSPNTSLLWSPHIEMGSDAAQRTPNRRFSPRAQSRLGNTPLMFQGLDMASFMRTPSIMQTPADFTDQAASSNTAAHHEPRFPAKRALLGPEGLSLSEILPNTVEGTPFQVGDLELTPVYSKPIQRTVGVIEIENSSDRKPYSKRQSNGSKRGEYKCGKCGFFPKKTKHDCDEFGKRFATSEDNRQTQMQSQSRTPLQPQPQSFVSQPFTQQSFAQQPFAPQYSQLLLPHSQPQLLMPMPQLHRPPANPANSMAFHNRFSNK